MTIQEAFSKYTNQLRNIYEEREAHNITDWVFESTGIKRLDRITNGHAALNNTIAEQLNYKLQELLQHKPVQYILQEAWFYKMKFFVNEHVLIPRPETEELVEWIINDVKIKNEELKVIDIGTGSGCIAISLKKAFTKADVLAIDVNEQALAVAAKNASILNTSIQFLQADFLKEKEWEQFTYFNVIVSNPPYIPEKEKASMGKNIVLYEPHLALFTEDADPSIFYKKIALFAQLHLKSNGKVYVEINEEYAEQVTEIFSQYNFKPTIKKDIYGKNRMIKAHL